MEVDLASVNLESDDGVDLRKGVLLTWGQLISEHNEERGNIGACTRTGLAAARPRHTQSERPSAEEGGGAGACWRERLLGYTGRKQRREKTPFFSFHNISKHFQMKF
jgi:hypothetical protein